MATMYRIHHFCKAAITGILLLLFSLPVSFAQPVISTMSVTSGPIGTNITVTGTGFNTNTLNSACFVGKVKVSLGNLTATGFKIDVPLGVNLNYFTYTDLSTNKTAQSPKPFAVTYTSLTNGHLAVAAASDFTTGTAPSGISAGDLNNDIKIDLVVANASSNTVSVFRSTVTGNNLNFATKSDFSTGANPKAVLLHDMDADGKLDIITANATDNTISILRNTTTDGATTFTFSAKQDFATGTAPTSLAVVDIDGDGRLDVVTNQSTGNKISILRNTSSGAGNFSFDAAIEVTTGNNPSFVQEGDIDGDGKHDIAVANKTDHTVSVFRNTSTSGSISFAAATDLTTGNNPVSIEMADMDTDGIADLVVANNGSNSVSVLRNTSTSGSISFAAKIDFAVGNSPSYAAIGEMNGDGKPDMVVTNSGANTLSLLRNTSTSGSLSCAPRVVTIATGSTPAFAICNDFSEDTKVDIVVANSGGTTMSVYENIAAHAPTIATMSTTTGASNTSNVQLTGTNFSSTTQYTTLTYGNVIANSVAPITVTSLTGSAPVPVPHNHLLVTNTKSNLAAHSSKKFHVTFTSNGNITFKVKQDISIATGPGVAVIGDLSRDLKNDLVILHPGSNMLSIYRNTSYYWANPVGSFATRQDISTGNNPSGICIGDLDGDTKPDIAVTNQNDNTVSLYLNTTTSITNITYAAKIDFATGNAPSGVEIRDMDGDGKPELIVTNKNDNTVSVLLNTSYKGNLSFDSKVDFATGNTPTKILMGDIDGDGKQDIAVINQADNTISVLRNTSTGIGSISFAARVNAATGTLPVSFDLGDIDGDGKEDFITANKTDNTFSVIRNTSTSGTISFAAKTDIATGNQPVSLMMEEFNGDGKLDIAVANQSDNTVYLYQNNSTSGVVSFDLPILKNVGTTPSFLLATDMDDNGLPEVMTCNTGTNTLTLLQNLADVHPVVNSFSVTNGTIGSTVGINGTNLNFSADQVRSRFGNSSQNVPSGVTATTANVVVPASANYKEFVYLKRFSGLAGYSPNPFYVTFTSNGVPSFNNKADFNTNTGPNAIVFADISDDGKLDIITANKSSNTISFLNNTSSSGNISFATKADYNTGNTPSSIIAGDVDGDNILDIVTSNEADNTLSIIRGIGGSLFTTKVDFTTGSTPRSVALGDLDIDGKPDLVAANFGGNTFSVLRNISNATELRFRSKVDIATGNGPSSIILKDIDGDGKIDVIVANRLDNTISIFRNTTSAIGAISFAAAVNFSTGNIPIAIAAGDFDLDGKADLAVVNNGSNTFSVFRNTSTSGNISMATKIDFATGSNPVSLVIGEVANGDGKAEITVANSGDNSISVFTNISGVGSINFDPKIDFTTGNGTSGVGNGDIDGDGKPDIASSNFSANTVSVLKNIIAKPTISSHPSNSTICAGTSTNFSVTASSLISMTYQWQVDNGGGFVNITNGGMYSNATTATLTISNATTTLNTFQYRCVVSNASGSTNSNAATLTVNALPTTPTISTAGNALSFCTGSSLNLTASAATTYQWYKDGVLIGGATNQTYNTTVAGDFTVVVTNAAGCISASSAIKSIAINALPATPTISTAGGASAFCSGSSLQLTASASTFYQWFKDGNPIGGATSQTYAATAAGSYTVQVTDANNCASAISSATVLTVNALPAVPTISTAGGASAFCSGSSLQLTASAATSYQWYRNGVIIGGATNQTYAATLAGDYTVVVGNSNGCTISSAITTLTVNALPATPTITTPGGATAFCVGGSLTLTSSAATSYQWYYNGAVIVGATNQTYVATAAGDYAVVVFNSNGCSSNTSATTTLSINALPPTATVTTAGGATAFCAGSSLTLTSSLATAYQWYRNAVLISGATNQTYAATTAGDYSVVVFNSNGCASASASAATSLTINALPATPTVTTTGGATAFCSGSSLTLTSSAATNYQWYRNGVMITGATSQTYAATTAGDYSVIVFNSNGCASATASANTTLTVNALPATPTVTTTGGATSFCSGSSLTLTSSAASNYQWYRNGVLITGATSQTYAATTAGDYSVIVFNSNGCASATASLNTTLTVNALPATPTVTTAGGATSFCAGSSLTLTSSAATNYQWYLNGVLIPGATSQAYVATLAGDYAVIVFNSNGCASAAASANTTLTINALPATPTVTTTGGATSFCSGSSLTLTSSPATNYQWYKNGILLAGATNQTYAATTAGDYSVIVFNSNGCASATASANTTLTVNTLPATPTVTTAGGATAFCAGSSLTLTSSPATNYQWYLNGAVIVGATSQTYAATSSGNYSVVVFNSNGCASASASANTTLTANSLPATPTVTTAGGATSFCSGNSLTLTSSPATSYQWYRNGVLLLGATSQNFVATNAGDYSVIVYNSNGCASASASANTSLTVNALPATPTVTTTGGATAFCAGSSLTLTSSLASNYQWYKNGILIPGATNQTYAATTAGDYAVIVFNSNGCASAAASSNTTLTVNALPASPTVTTAGGATAFCAGSSLTLTSSVGTAYQWYYNGATIVGATNQTYAATAAGDYSVVVFNNNGCGSNASTNTTLSINALPSNPTVTTAGGATAFCAGSSLTLSSSLATAYQWYRNGVLIVGATNQNFTATTAGDYAVVVFNSNGCASASLSAITSITVNPLPATPTVTTNGGITSFCTGGSITLTSSVATSYQWYRNGILIAGAISQNYVATTAGDYAVMVYNSSGCMSASASANTTITLNTIPAQPVVTSITGATAFCTGNSVTLTSTIANAYQWYLNGTLIPGATNRTLVVTTAGNYGVVISNGNGCQSTLTPATSLSISALSLPASPVISNISNKTLLCNTDTILLASSASSGNQWYLNNNLITGATSQLYRATMAGDYTVTTTNANGCTSNPSASISITAPPSPVITTSGGINSFCSGDSLLLTSSTITGNQWYRDSTPIPGATAPSYFAKLQGSYFVKNIDANGCYSTSVTLYVIEAGMVKITSTGGVARFCEGSSLVLTSTSSTGNQWFFNNVLLPGEINQTLKVTQPGSYKVQITLKGCTAISPAFDVSMDSAAATPVITTPNNATSICVGGTLLLSSSTANSYQWFKDGQPIAGANNKTYTASQGGKYSVVTTNAAGCSSKASADMIVTENGTMETTIMPDTLLLCMKNTYQFQNVSSLATWSITDSSIASLIGKGNVIAVKPGVTNILYQTTTNNGCIKSVVNPLRVVAIPVLSVTPKNASVSRGKQIRLTSMVSADVTAISWTPVISIDNPNSYNPMARPLSNTTYIATVTNANGCQAVDSAVIVSLEDYQALEPTILLTPNGDGVNETLILKNIDAYPDNTLEVFDKAGRKIYQASNYHNQWNGTVENRPLTNDTYYYVLKIKGKIIRKGAVTILVK